MDTAILLGTSARAAGAKPGAQAKPPAMLLLGPGKPFPHLAHLFLWLARALIRAPPSLGLQRVI
eukprot:8620658-Pyramimonas_sp.AAC.1